jgi:hypothetical protein
MGLASICTGLVAIVAVIVGTFVLTDIPKKAGFYRWLVTRAPALVGMTPAHHYGIPWGYTYDEYYTNCDKIRGQQALVRAYFVVVVGKHFAGTTTGVRVSSC